MSFDFFFGHNANQSVDDLAAFEKKHSRYVLNVIF